MSVPRYSAALIGDLVGSRRSVDRGALHRRLEEVLAGVNERLTPRSPLRVVAGDEFQGVFDDLGEAIAATLLIRLALAPVSGVRHGVGWGTLEVLVEEPRIEDGPAWWAARAGIEAAAQGERGTGPAVRTAYVVADGVAGPDPAAVNAALTLRDVLVGGLSPRSVSVLRGLLDGRSQREIADELGISSSAVSQRVRKDGLAAVVAAHSMLGEVR
jgi:hypothetical protein